MELLSGHTAPHIGVVIITGSCCIPGMGGLDERVRNVVEQAAAEMGVTLLLKVIPAANAYFGAVPRTLVARLFSDFQQSGKVSLPAVLIDGEVISTGVPEAAAIKAALLQAARKTPTKEGPILES